MLDKFKNFLEEKKVFALYCQRVDEGTWNENVNTLIDSIDTREWVVDAFDWTGASEGHEFWMAINLGWKKLYDSIT
jgi:hypothetical protein